jgi:hypothetical protein
VALLSTFKHDDHDQAAANASAIGTNSRGAATR